MKRSLKRVRAWQEQTVKYKSVARFLKNLFALIFLFRDSFVFNLPYILYIYAYIG